MKNFYNSFMLLSSAGRRRGTSRLYLKSANLPLLSNRFLCCFAIVFLSLLSSGLSFAQAPTISYPTIAEPLTRGLGSSLLTVKVSFPAACENISVEIDLPDGVSYVPGSVVKTQGVGSQTITADGGTANRPKFAITNAAAGNDIEFTIARIANCGTGNGKDEVYVTSSCGNVSETVANVNNYNILAPALSMTAPAAIANGSLGSNYSRTFNVTNGGTGDLDTLLLYVVRPSGSVGSPVIKVGSATIPVARSNGDSTFYEVWGANLPGGDNRMANGETVIFTEEFTLVNCSGLSTYYGSSWGSNKALCQTTTVTGLVTMSSAVPRITTTIVGDTPINACGTVPRTLRLTISNTSGPATSINVKVGGTYNGAFFPYAYYLDTASVNVTLPLGAGTYHPTNIVVTNAINNSGNSPLCALGKPGMISFNLPNGYVLPAGQDIVVTFNVQTCEGGPCEAGTYDPGRIAAQVTYKDQCGNESYILPLSGGVIPGIQINGGAGQSELPAQVFAGDSFNYKLFSGITYTTGTWPRAYIEYRLKLPVGITFDGTVTDAVTNDLSGGPSMVSGFPRMEGDTLVLRYVPTMPSSGIMYQQPVIKLQTAGDACGVKNIQSQSKFTMDSACANPLFRYACINNNITVICPDECPTGGATPVYWTHNRITYGSPDNDNNGRPDASGEIDTNRVVRTHYRPGDVMRSYVESIVSANQPEPYTSWPYVYGEWDFGTGLTWQPEGSATIKIKRGGTIIHNLTGINPVALTAGVKFKADWSSSLPGGFTYLPGDSIFITADFKLVGNTSTSGATVYGPLGGRTKYTKTLSQTVYASQVANPPAGELVGPGRFSCFTPQYNYYAYGSEHFVSISAGQNGANGCTNFGVNAVLYSIVGDYLNARFFPYEHRPTHIPDVLTYTIPAGWEYISSSTAMDFNTAPGTHSSTPLSITPTVTGNSVTGTTVVLDYRSVLGAGGTPGFTSTEGAQFPVNIVLRASCSAPESSTLSLNEKGHFGYYPNNTFNEANPANYDITGATILNYAIARPNIAIQNNTGIVQGTAPQHFWDIDVKNTNNQASASNVWLSLEKGSSGITIDSVVLKPSNVVLTPNNYGTADKWYQFASSLGAATPQSARIYFKYSGCSIDGIKASIGWNCAGYPATDPTASTSCSDDELVLQVLPQPSLVQLKMAKQPVKPSLDLCEEDYVEAVINSALGANVDNPEITIIPPVGLDVVLPFRVEYPIGSGTWQDVTATNNSGQYIVNLEEHVGIGLDGLPGTLANPDSSGRLAKIRVRYTASCDFVSGSRVGFIVGGDRPCGGAVGGDGDYINSAPINITGVEVTGTAGLTLNIGNTTLTCSAPETMNLQITPTGSPTIEGDVAVYTLPAGLAYVNASFTAGTNCTGCTIAVTSGTGGSTVLTVSLPEGVAAGNAIQFAVGIRAADVENGCGNKTITGEMQRLVGGLSCGSVECEVSKAVIGSTSQVISILKPQLDVTSITLTKSGDQVSYSIVVINNGTVASEVGYQLKVYCGPISNDNVVETVSTRAIAAGGTDTYTGTYDISSCTSGSDMFAQVGALMGNNDPACSCATPAFATTEAPLPVTLLSFKGTAEGQTALLNWVTTAETNSDRFEVEQSLNGKTWNKVGTVPAKGNSVARVPYTFTDANPDNGQNLYRLRVIDRDGKFGLSNIIGLNFQVDAVKLFPSPVSDKLTMRAQDWDKVSDVEMYDNNGKMVYESHRGTSSKVLAQEINVKQFSAGVYMVRISRKNGVVTVHKVVVIR